MEVSHHSPSGSSQIQTTCRMSGWHSAPESVHLSPPPWKETTMLKLTNKPKRVFAVVSLAIMFALTLGAGTALASSQGSTGAGAYGSYFALNYYLHGASTYIYYVDISASGGKTIYHSDGTSEEVLDFPNFVGCRTHVQFYNSRPGGEYRSWNSPEVSCTDFINSGARALLSIYQDVPEGKYCSTIWVSNYGTGYVSSGAACAIVHR